MSRSFWALEPTDAVAGVAAVGGLRLAAGPGKRLRASVLALVLDDRSRGSQASGTR